MAVEFFSILAQVIATAIGFIIAIIAALYAFRRSQTTGRIETMVDEFEDIDDEYRSILERMATDLLSRSNNPAASSSLKQLIEIDLDQNHIDQKAQSFADPESAKSYINIKRGLKMLSLITGPQPIPTKKMHTRRLHETAEALKDSIYLSKGASLIHKEISGNNPNENDIRDSIFSDYGEMREWIEDNHIREDHQSIAGWSEIIDQFHTDVRHTGRYIQGSEFVVGVEDYVIIFEKCVIFFL